MLKFQVILMEYQQFPHTNVGRGRHSRQSAIMSKERSSDAVGLNRQFQFLKTANHLRHQKMTIAFMISTKKSLLFPCLRFFSCTASDLLICSSV